MIDIDELLKGDARYARTGAAAGLNRRDYLRIFAFLAVGGTALWCANWLFWHIVAKLCGF